jgi:hypothetical protein
MLTRGFAVGLACVVTFGVCAVAIADENPTFREMCQQSDFIVLGKTEWLGAKITDPMDFVIIKVIKNHSMLDGKKKLRLPPDIQPDNGSRSVQFGDVYHGEIRVGGGLPGSDEMVTYLTGLLKHDHEALVTHCFKHLENRDENISRDAFRQIFRSSEADMQAAFKRIQPDKIRERIKEKKSDSYRLYGYANLLGYCGTSEDVPLLAKLLREELDRKGPYLEGIFRSYTLLDPRAGWAAIRENAKDSSVDFTIRCHALNAAAYFYSTRPGVISQKDVLEVIGLFLSQRGIADLAVDYLRRWKCWKLTDRVLAIATTKEFDNELLRCSVIQYALLCPDDKAKKFVVERRKVDPAGVEDAELRLKLEMEAGNP